MSEHKKHSFVRVALLIILALSAALALPACGASQKPTIVISAPASGTQVTEGQMLTVQSVATDAKGIIRVDLLVDDKGVHTENAPSPQKSFQAVQSWKASGPGKHKISVVAYNKDAAASDFAAIEVVVVAAPAPAPTAAPATATVSPAQPSATATLPKPTAAPATATAILPTATPVPPTATPVPPCTNNAAFVADVTVPDGSPMQPNQRFDKIWRVQNTGSCTWNNRYQLVFVGGEAMAGVTAVGVPSAAPNSAADLLVPMTAPAAPGAHSGQWQLRTDAGVPFGPVLTVKINVPAPQPTPCVPQLNGFWADRTTINRGEGTVLRWGAVNNAQRVEIDNGIGGVATPGERVVAPPQTTTYTLYATCGNNTVTAQVTINVIQPAPPTATPLPERINLSGEWDASGYTMELQEALGCMRLPCGYAGRFIIITAGAPEIGQLNGQFDGRVLNFTAAFTDIPGKPPIHFTGTVSANGRTITGQLSTGPQVVFGRR